MNVLNKLEESKVCIKKGFNATAMQIIDEVLSDLRVVPVHTKAEELPKTGREIVVDALIKDFLERKEFGAKKYGSPLMTFNGRNALIDLYQELHDATVYCKQVLMEYGTVEQMVLENLWQNAKASEPIRDGWYPVWIEKQYPGDVTAAEWNRAFFRVGEGWESCDEFGNGFVVVKWMDIQPPKAKETEGA